MLSLLRAGTWTTCGECKYGYGSTAYIMQVTRMGDAIKATGRSIFYSTDLLDRDGRRPVQARHLQLGAGRYSN